MCVCVFFSFFCWVWLPDLKKKQQAFNLSWKCFSASKIFFFLFDFDFFFFLIQCQMWCVVFFFSSYDSLCYTTVPSFISSHLKKIQHYYIYIYINSIPVKYPIYCERRKFFENKYKITKYYSNIVKPPHFFYISYTCIIL